LRWLKQQQQKDGHWGENQNRVVLTSLATLAFLCNEVTPDNSREFSETVRNALEALMRDVEAGAERTGETDALLTYCLTEAFERTLNPSLSKAVEVQTNRLDFTHPSYWHVYAAKSLSLSGAFGSFGREGTKAMFGRFPANTTNMFNQATCLLQGMYAGDAMQRASSFKALRQMDLAQWKTQDDAMRLALLLSHVFYHVGGQEWVSWQKLFFDDLYKKQFVHGKLGWWTSEGLGMTTRGLEKYTQREREVYITSIALLTFPPERNLPVFIQAVKVVEELKPVVVDPDDIKVEIMGE
jgi:hypothetical protein